MAASQGWQQRQRADQLVRLGRFAEARDLLEPLLVADPADADLHRALARCYLGLSDTGRALQTALAAVDLEPGAADGRILLSAAYAAFDLRPQAVAAAERAVEIEPDGWASWLCFAQALALDGEQLTDAWLASMAAVQRGPNVPAVHRTVGDVAAQLGWLGKARTAYERSLALDPSDAATLDKLARLQLREHDAGAATTGFLSALQAASPDDRSDSSDGLERTGRALLSRACLMALLSTFIVAWSFQAELPLVLGAWPGPIRLATGVAVTALLVGLNLPGWRRTPRDVRRSWWAGLRLPCVLTLLACAGAVLGGFLPVLLALVLMVVGTLAGVACLLLGGFAPRGAAG